MFPKTQTTRRCPRIIAVCRLVAMLLAAMSLPGIVPAQSLDSLVAESVAHNPKLRSLAFKTQAAEYKAGSVGTLPSPTLTVEFSEIPFGTYDLWNEPLSQSVALSQMFMLGGKRGAMADVERKSSLAVAEAYDAYKANLIGLLRMSYYTVWAIDRTIEIQTKTLTAYDNLFSSANVLYAVNRTSQTDLITVKSEMVSIRTQLLDLQRKRESEIYKMNKLLGRELSSAAVVIDRSIGTPDMQSLAAFISYEGLEEELLARNPTLRQMNRMIDMNTGMLAANDADRVPDLMVQAMVMRQPRGMILTSKLDLSMLTMLPQRTEYMYSLMASISLPFAPWSSGKYSAKEDELSATATALEFERADMKREMISSLRTAMVKLKAADDQIALYAETVMPLYEEAIKTQMTAFQNNQLPINTLIDAFRMHLMHEMNYYMAQADYQMALAEIEMMIGRDLRKGE